MVGAVSEKDTNHLRRAPTLDNPLGQCYTAIMMIGVTKEDCP